jgi:hypothetical protein
MPEAMGPSQLGQAYSIQDLTSLPTGRKVSFAGQTELPYGPGDSSCWVSCGQATCHRRTAHLGARNPTR